MAFLPLHFHMSASLSRRRFLRIFAGSALAAPRLAGAAEFARELRIEVLKGDWGCPPGEVRAVVRAAAQEIWTHCGGQRLRPLLVYQRADFPQTDFLHDWRGRIRIGVAAAERRWAQTAFQFAHEFIHALAQHSEAARRAWRTARQANLWFEEALGETASLFALRRMAGRTPPLFAPGPGDASALAEFAAARLARPGHQLPGGASFAAWFAENEPALRENGALRAKNVIVARQLLPLFEAEPGGWAAACFLNLGRRDRGKSRAQYFAEWQEACPAELRPFVTRVADVFTTR